MPTEDIDKQNQYNDIQGTKGDNVNVEETINEEKNTANEAGDNNTTTDEKNKTELDRLYEDAEDEIDQNNYEIDKTEQESQEAAEEYNKALKEERAIKAIYKLTALEKFKRAVHDFNEQQNVNAIYQKNKAEEAVNQDQQQQVGQIARSYKETAQRLYRSERQGMGNPFVDSEYLHKVAEMIEKRLQDEQKQFEQDKKNGEREMDVAKKINDDRVERRNKEDINKEKTRDKLLRKRHDIQASKTNELQKQKETLKDLERKNADVNSNFEEEKEDILSKMGLERQEKKDQNSNKIADNLKNDKKDNNISSLMNALKQMEKMKSKQKEEPNNKFKIESIEDKQNENPATANILNDVKYDKSNNKKPSLSI